MSTTTALQMVNRFMRKYRLDTVADFSSPQALAALDCLNDAKEETLDSRMWGFDERDGAIATLPYYATAATALPFVNGANLATLGNDQTGGATLYGNHSLRCIPTTSTDRAQTSHVCSAVQITIGIFNLYLTNAYDGTSGSYSVDAFAAEYQFPAHDNGDSKVKQLLSMTHQERPLRLEEVDKNFRFDSAVTRLHDSIGSDPEVVYFGRPVQNTGNATAGVPVTTLRDGFMVWPVPTLSTRLDYTYRYRHAQLEDIADTLENVPDAVVSAIVELAYGFSLNTMFGNDPTKADRVIKAAITRIERLHDADKKTPHKSKPVHSMDSLGRGRSGRQLPSGLITGY